MVLFHMAKKKEFEEKISYLLRDMKLSVKEAKNAARFIIKHRSCPTICRSFCQTKYEITFSVCSVGSWVTIKCDKCSKHRDISDDVRSNW